MIDETGPVELIYHHGTEPVVLFALIGALMAAVLLLALVNSK